MITSNFSAEYGRVGGGVINAALKIARDVNQIYGTAYEFLRNTDLNAIGYIFGARPSTLSETYDAPQSVRRPRSAVRLSKISCSSSEIAKASGSCRVISIFIPFPTRWAARVFCRSHSDRPDRNGDLSGELRQIPVSQLNPFAAAALAGLAAPNFGTAATNPVRTISKENIPLKDYSTATSTTQKLDYVMTAKMTAFLRFSQRKDISYYGPADPGPSGGDGNGFIHAIQQQAAAGYTWTTSSNSLLEFRFGFDHVLGGKAPPYLGGPNIASEFGIQGLPAQHWPVASLRW